MQDGQVSKSTEHKTGLLDCVRDDARNEVALTMEDLKNSVAVNAEVPVKKVYDNIMTPLFDQGLNILTSIPSYNSTKTALYRRRKSEQGVSKLICYNIADVEIPKSYKYLILGDYKTENKRIIVICSEEGKNLLRVLKEYFCDGTFKSVPRPFAQLLTMHGDLGSTADKTDIVPILYALMSDKSEESYSIVYDIIKANISDWEPNILHADFEMGLTNPLKIFFPNVMIKRCHYHFMNSLWRKAKENDLKSKLYRRVVGLCAALPLLPPEKVFEGYEYIKNQAKTLNEEKLKPFLTYMEKTWLKNETFIKEWCIYDQRHRTNNFAEGWHSKLNRQINKNYVTILKLLSVLKTDMAINKRQINNFQNGINSNKRRKIQSDRDSFILNAQLQLLHGEINIGHFLEMMR